MAFDSTAGSPTANSFLSVERADEINEVRIFPLLWANKQPEDKQRLLATATRSINAICYKLSKATLEQALKFPSTGETIIPLEIELATAEWAYQLAASTSDRSVESTLQTLGITKIKADVVELAFREDPQASVSAKHAISMLPASVLQFIPQSWLCDDYFEVEGQAKRKVKVRFY